jgi:fumarylacetoacetate (FAA) hydrolase
MKLATLKDGSRDGQLLVVARDLRTAAIADAIAPTLQRALDDWSFYAPQLTDLYDALNQSRERHAFDFVAADCMAPLPRAYQWADGSAYVNHVELVRRARGASMPPEFWTDPLMYQGGSDDFLGPNDDIVCSSESFGIDFEAEVAVISADVPMGVTPADALGMVRLLMLVNDVSLRNLIPAELAKGFGFFHGKPSTAFSPVAVTPDELGEHWREGRVHRPMIVHWNGRKVGQPDCGTDMAFHFGQLIAHAAKTRKLGAGSVVGSGTISNVDNSDGGSGGGRGYCCIAEKRCLETLEHGAPQTDFMKFGDRVRIEMFDSAGKSIFGAIDQTVEPLEDAQPPAATQRSRAARAAAPRGAAAAAPNADAVPDADAID